ncbi:hypothetical protein EDB85DRAFT_2241856 [Lactarius pseudohatsudake]|nr:hypothetical protein EDB85DRAFT_2241856 [Lactarius pseudohatsudake]
MQSQMEAKLASMNLKSPGLKSTISGFPLRPHSAPAPRTASRLPSTPLHLPHLRNPPMPSATQATPPPTLAQQHAKLKASGNVARRISAPELAASRERGTGAGVLGPGAEWDNFSTQEILVEPWSSRPQSTDFPGLSASSSFRSPYPDGGATPGAGWPRDGRRRIQSRTCLSRAGGDA